MKVEIPMLSRGKTLVAALVRERRGSHEGKLEVAKLRETLVHEEFDVKVEDVYDFSEGKDSKEVGGFGEVQVVCHRKTGARFAVKTVALSRLKSKGAFDRAMQEVDLLKALDHPNIVRLQEVYVTPSRLYVAMDFMEGGNLAQRYLFDGEDKAAHIVRQIVRALRYLHDRKIAHRDLKLDNILLEHSGPGATVKLVDFGLSGIFEDDGVSHDVLGSWNYVAPEVIAGKSRPVEADMWSLGVVAYVLMSGKPPFDDTDTEMIKRRVLAARYTFSGKAWANASEDSKHFIRSLLQKTARLRMSAARAQEHPWLRRAEEVSQASRVEPGFAENLTRSMLDFRVAKPMKQLALEVVARTLDPIQIRHLAQEFDRADKTNDGEVSLAEFKRWMASNECAQGLGEEDVEGLFSSIDVDGSGLIHFNEFLAATIPQRSLDEAALKAAFDRLDRSHTGFISLRDLTLMTGAAANAEESAVLIEQFDIKGDGQISFAEFVEGIRRIDSESEMRILRSLSASSPLPAVPRSPASCATHPAFRGAASVTLADEPEMVNAERSFDGRATARQRGSDAGDMAGATPEATQAIPGMDAAATCQSSPAAHDGAKEPVGRKVDPAAGSTSGAGLAGPAGNGPRPSDCPYEAQPSGLPDGGRRRVQEARGADGIVVDKEAVNPTEGGSRGSDYLTEGRFGPADVEVDVVVDDGGGRERAASGTVRRAGPQNDVGKRPQVAKQADPAVLPAGNPRGPGCCACVIA